MARDGRGDRLPVEVALAGFKVAGQQRTLLTLRDLRAGSRNLENAHGWMQVFQDSGWGMAMGTVAEKPVLERVNPAYASMLGYQPAELAGIALRQCIDPSCWDALQELRAAAEGGRPMQAQMQHIRRDGTTLPTLVSLLALRNDAGAVTQFVVSVQDITPLKKAEEAATRHALHLRAVLDALPVGVWIGDDQGSVQQTNLTAQRLWSGTDTQPDEANEANRANPWWTANADMPISHDSLMRRAAVVRASVDSGLVELMVPAGGRRTLQTTASPILDAAGSVVGAIAIDEDLTTLHQREAAARQARDQLERILDACTVGLALTTAQGRVRNHNLAWTVLVGSAVQDNVLGETLEPGDTSVPHDLIGRVTRNDIPAYAGEHRMRRATGGVGWTLLVVSRLPGAWGQEDQALVQVFDIDERRRIAEEISGSRLRLAAAQKLARMGDWQWDIQSGRVDCSDQMLRMMDPEGKVKDALFYDFLMQMVRPDERPGLSAAIERALQGGGALSRDISMTPSDGVELIVNVQGVAQRTPAGMSMAGTMQDITERKHTEFALREARERLRELVAHESDLIESERKRIAREVHDELGQLLTASRMDLSMLMTQLTPGSAAAQRALQMRETMTSMTEVVRHVASHLRPAALDLGLTAAIEWLAEDFSLRWETQCDLHLPRDNEPELTESASLALFRAVQESLTNIAKHAQATRVSISMKVEGDMLTLQVADNGRGFDPVAVAARRGGGLGLLGMRERMHAIGADFAIQTSPAGTHLEIQYTIARSIHT